MLKPKKNLKILSQILNIFLQVTKIQINYLSNLWGTYLMKNKEINPKTIKITFLSLNNKKIFNLHQNYKEMKLITKTKKISKHLIYRSLNNNKLPSLIHNSKGNNTNTLESLQISLNSSSNSNSRNNNNNNNSSSSHSNKTREGRNPNTIKMKVLAKKRKRFKQQNKVSVVVYHVQSLN